MICNEYTWILLVMVWPLPDQKVHQTQSTWAHTQYFNPSKPIHIIINNDDNNNVTVGPPGGCNGVPCINDMHCCDGHTCNKTMGVCQGKYLNI